MPKSDQDRQLVEKLSRLAAAHASAAALAQEIIVSVGERLGLDMGGIARGSDPGGLLAEWGHFSPSSNR